MSSEPFWSSRRVLVTGHTGFKGPWLCQALLRKGAEVMGYALPAPTEPSLFHLLDLSDRMRHNEADVCDANELQRCILSFKPEIVFHLAAQSVVLESYRNPVDTFSTNVMGTVNLLEAVRQSDDVLACVVVTSDKCYETDESGRPHREDDSMGGSDVYSASKGCAELVTAAYRRSLFQRHQARIASVRAGNVIGGGDWTADQLVPDIVRALTTGSALVLRRPDAVRPWQHVLEPVAAYMTLAERIVEDGSLEGGWNFGPEPGDVWPVQRVVSEFVAVWGDTAEAITIAPSEFPETGHLALDSSKARVELGWSPRWGVREAIERTVRWYHSFYREGAGALALVDADLDAYGAPNLALRTGGDPSTRHSLGEAVDTRQANEV